MEATTTEAIPTTTYSYYDVTTGLYYDVSTEPSIFYDVTTEQQKRKHLYKVMCDPIYNGLNSNIIKLPRWSSIRTYIKYL